jgi:predicted metal-dependent hydrolase
MAPTWVADYVVVHELCHLRQMDHSARFWRLLDDACPGRRQAQQWLRVHGPELLAHRP